MKDITQQRRGFRSSFRVPRASSIARALLVLLVTITLGRLLWLQVGKGQVWRVQAEGNRRQRVTVVAPRGLLLDRNGVVVARNQGIFVQPYVDENRKLQERLLNEMEAVQLQATAPAQVKKMYLRQYPYGPILSHVLGYTSRARLSHEGVTGESGVERYLEDQLSGVNGEIWFERSARGEANRVLAERDPQAGQDITLTIDAELSKVAYQALGDQAGSVVVTNPRGEVLVAVSTPSFVPYHGARPGQESFPVDTAPLLLGDPFDPTVWVGNPAPSISAALVDERSPLLFRAVAGTYPPGSVFKIVTALAGLEREAITGDTTVNDEGVLRVGEFSYQNWYWRQYGRVDGSINVVRALARSNDIFFYRLAEWVGPDTLAEFSRWMGLGSATGIEGQSERLGLVPTPAWKQQNFGERWFLGNTFHYGIGQGDLLVTPVQVARLMNTVATRGRQCELHIVSGSPVPCQEMSFQEETWALVVQGLRQACAPGGTAFPFFPSSYDVMCKTGTAEFGAANEQGYRRTHGWFTAAVSRQPRQSAHETIFNADIIVTVMVEADDTQPYKEGSREAAPIAKIVAEAWLAANGVPADQLGQPVIVPEVTE